MGCATINAPTASAFPIPFSHQEVINQAVLNLPTKTILVAKEQGVKKKQKPHLGLQNSSISG